MATGTNNTVCFAGWQAGMYAVAIGNMQRASQNPQAGRLTNNQVRQNPFLLRSWYKFHAAILNISIHKW